MSDVAIIQVGPESAAAVLDFVDLLLQELGEEGDESGSLDRAALTAAWSCAPQQQTAFLVKTASGQVIGGATLATSFAIYAGGHYGIINEFFIAPPFRSSGLGQQLLAAIIKHGRLQNWSRIDVAAPESERWKRTRQFYEREGFVYTGPKLKMILD